MPVTTDIDPNKFFVGRTGNIWVAELGATLPVAADGDDEVSTVDPDFVRLGATTTDGVSFTPEESNEEIGAWQASGTVLVLNTERNYQFAFAGMEWSQHLFNLAFGATFGADDDGFTDIDFPGPGEAKSEFAVVVETLYGDKLVRACMPRVTVETVEEVVFQRNNTANLGLTLKTLEPADDAKPLRMVAPTALFTDVLGS